MRNAGSVLLVTPWYGGDNNGVGILTETLAEALRAAGHECVVIELLPDGILPRRRIGRTGETIWGVCLRAKPSAYSLRAYLAYRLRSYLCRRLIRRLSRDYSLQIAHFHYASTFYGTIASMLRSVSVPWMVTFHGSDLEINVADPECLAVMRELVSRARAVSAVSEALQAVAVRVFPELREKIVVVHNSVASALVTEASVAASQGRNAPVILFLGNLIKRKGVDVLVSAWAELVRSGHAPKPWKVVIAGAGLESDSLVTLTREFGIGDRIQFIGAVHRSEVPALLAASSIMVIPSRAEPFGLVAAEGQLFGCAVIASDVGGLREVVLDRVTGLLVPPDDPSALANALAVLVNDPGRRHDLGCAAHAHALKEFAPARMADEYLRLYALTRGRNISGDSRGGSTLLRRSD